MSKPNLSAFAKKVPAAKAKETHPTINADANLSKAVRVFVEGTAKIKLFPMSKPNLSAFAKKVPAAKAKETHPTINADANLSKAVRVFVEGTAKIKALEGSVATAKALLRGAAYPKWVDANMASGAKFDSTVVIAAEDQANDKGVVESGPKVNMTFTNGYRSSLDETASEKVKNLIGKKNMDTLFKEDYTLTIKGSTIPKDNQDEFLAELAALVEKHGMDPSQVVEAKTTHLPLPEFSNRRMAALTKEQNLELDKLLATPTMVKESTKGE